MNYPQISIIIPVYNAEKYIKKCIDSILNQTLADFEVILIDDGSTDSSREICDEYAEIDTRIKVVHCENNGAGKARNIGLDNARGEFIFFVDSDDWLEKNALESHLRYMDNYDMSIGCSKNCYFNNETIKSSSIDYYYPAGKYKNKEDVRNMYVDIAVNGVSHAPHNKMYKKNIIDKFSIRFPDYKKYEDLTFNNQYIDKINSLVIIEETVYNYRVNSAEGVALKLPSDMFEIFSMVNDDLISLLKRWGVFDDVAKFKLQSHYITDVASCINNTYNPYLYFNFNKRYKYIKKIINNDKVKISCGNVDSSLFVKVISKFMKLKMILLIMICYRIKFIGRKFLKGI